MDYPERWKQKLFDEEERKRRAQEHWRPTWPTVAALVVTAILFAIAFWPGGCAAPSP